MLPEWLNWRVLAGALLIALTLTCLGLLLVFGPSQGRPSEGGSAGVFATAVLNIIPAPTFTVDALAPEGGAAPTLPAPPSPVPGAISLNAYVQITATQGAGLRLRSEPSLNGAVQLIGSEAEVFIVKDGPREADGYTWWYLVGPFDAGRAGWAVANYLIVVQGP